MAITNLTAGEPLSCSSVADRDKELTKAVDEWRAAIDVADRDKEFEKDIDDEKAIDEWKAPMRTPREIESKKKVEENSKLFFQALRDCHQAKAVRYIVTIVSLIVAGIGFLLTIVGFFIGRKKAIT